MFPVARRLPRTVSGGNRVVFPSRPKVITSRKTFSVEKRAEGLLLSQQGIVQDLPEEMCEPPQSRHFETEAESMPL